MAEGLDMNIHLNVDDFRAGLDRLAERADTAVELSVRRGIAYFAASAQKHAPMGKSTGNQARARQGIVGEPHHVGGTLRRSIRIIMVRRSGEARWTAVAGPSVVYGRQRDRGGTIRARNAPWLKFNIGGHWVQVKEVTQSGSFFMEKGLEDTRVAWPEIFRTGWIEVMAD